MYEYSGFVDDVDLRNTLKITLDMGFGVKTKKKFTLNGIQCRDNPTYATRHVYIRLHELVVHKDVYIKTYKNDGCSDCVYAADVYVSSDSGLTCINDILVIEDLAVYKDY